MADQTPKPQGTFSRLMSSTLLHQKQKTENLEEQLIQEKKAPQFQSKSTNLQTKEENKKSNYASIQASKLDSSKASNQASMIAFSSDALETTRRVAKNPGKEEVIYVRLSKEEKDSLADISYRYKRQGIRTSDNEVVRVAINALLEDYKTNGANSLLALVISSLHA